MVATLLGLKLRLVVGEMRRSVARLVTYIIIAANVLLLAVLLLIALIAASWSVEGNEALVGMITVISGSLIVVGWTILPLLFFGSDQTLDPSRLVLFPLSGRKLAPGLILAGAIGMPGLFTVLISLGSALPWINSPLILSVGLLGGALGFLMTQLCCRTASTALSGLLSTRKAKDRTGLIALVVVLILSMSGYVVSIGVAFFLENTSGFVTLAASAERISSVLAWTPLGAPWALAADAALGQWWMMLAHLCVTVIYLFLGLLLYAAVLDKALLTPVRTGSTSVSRHDSIARSASWLWAKKTLVPVAAITARCQRYWRCDPRYLGQIAGFLVVIILFVLMGITLPMLGSAEEAELLRTGGKWLIASGLAFSALMTGYILCADVASDATAWWIHLSAGVKGWQDRLGRILAQAIWAMPVILLAGVLVPIIANSSERIPATLSAMITFYLTSTASAAIFSALIIYPVPLPGESPLRMKTGMMGMQMLAQMGCLTAGALCGLPIAVWAIFATGWQAWLVLIIGVLWGFGVLIAGIIFGGKIMDYRGSAILQTLITNDSRERF